MILLVENQFNIKPIIVAKQCLFGLVSRSQDRFSCVNIRVAGRFAVWLERGRVQPRNQMVSRSEPELSLVWVIVGRMAARLRPAWVVLCYSTMSWPFPDPLALSTGAGLRLALAGLVAAALWGAVAWAMVA